MFASLASRIAALGAVVIIALSALVWMLVNASMETRDSFRWVNHSTQVIETTVNALTALEAAESGQRGFILTRNPIFAQNFEQNTTDANRAIGRAVALTADNPAQNARARVLLRFFNERITVLNQRLDMALHGDFDKARDLIATGRGLDIMTEIAARTDSFLDNEHTLQAMRVNAASALLTQVRQLSIIGGAAIVLLILLVSLAIIRGIRRAARVMGTAMTALGSGEHTRRITDTMGSSEFASLAAGYNLMADRLEAAVADTGRSERELQIANDELSRSSDSMRNRGEVIELLGGMAHRMQAARTDEELAQVIRVFVPRVLPGIPGALYAHNNSRNLLVPIAGWGGLEPERDGFAPDQCWALRRGQSHFVTTPGNDIVCSHVEDKDSIYHCEPLLAGGEVIGTLYLQGIVDEEAGFRLTVMAENIASALVNHRLQRGLREQTIRDPLTGLFNRRYMEETLAIEIARSCRSGAPLSVVMCDVDHFKRFNDEFGHDAGDTVLQAVAAEMRARFRDSDVVCRFGGEEFTIIAPGATAASLAERVEPVRQAIAAISLRQNGRTLGSASMSFGIASWDNVMSRDGAELIRAADAALYRAKREGRNRTIIGLLEAA